MKIKNGGAVLKNGLSPILLAGMVTTLLGCEEASLISPELFSQESVIAASKAAHSTSDVWKFSDLSVVGSSKLVRHGNSMSMTLQTSDIPPGMAITVWWVIFNNPENCTSPTAVSQCGEPDIFDPAVRTDVNYATGHVTGNGNHINFAAQRKVGDASGSVMPFFNALLGLSLPSVGLENLSGAEVHLVVRTHQQKLSSHMPDMIQTFNGGCTYPAGAPTDFGQPGPNTCSDIQFAVHQS